jgi:hypothetical protein
MAIRLATIAWLAWLPLVVAASENAARPGDGPQSRRQTGVGALVSVDATEVVRPFDTVLSTNLASPGALEQSAREGNRGPQLLNAWQPQLLRIHVGTNGWREDPDTGRRLYGLPSARNPDDWDFTALDGMVRAAQVAGSAPVVNVRYAPNWMWECRRGMGAFTDFDGFAAYMAALVGWYNAETYTRPDGSVRASGWAGDPVTYWEIWNEPDLSDETPCRRGGNGQALTAQEYVQLWNKSTAAMLAVDPAITFVGPGVTQWSVEEYVPALLDGAVVQPAVISFHVYGAGANAARDRAIFATIPRIADLAAFVNAQTGGDTPIWVDEANVNASFPQPDPRMRPRTAFGAAWLASLFRALALEGVGAVHQYEFIADRQFALVPEFGRDPFVTYWSASTISRGLPPEGDILAATRSTPGIEALAIARDPGNLALLVIDQRAKKRNDVGGRGVPATVTIEVNGATVDGANALVIDRATSRANGPAVQVLDPNAMVVTLAGYGVAVVEISVS